MTDIVDKNEPSPNSLEGRMAAAGVMKEAKEHIEWQRDEIERLRAENERLRKALIKVCDRAHKVQVGCPSESFDIAIKEAKLMLNDTMPLAPFPNEPPFPSTAEGDQE